MCALATLLPCPICAHRHFESVDSLRDKLIYVSTHSLTCPVCQEEVSGLDKLTIHLFSHVHIKVNDMKSKMSEPQREKSENKRIIEKPQMCKRPRTQPTKNKIITSSKAPVKLVKIYPKLPVISLNTMPIVQISHNSISDTLNKPLCLSAITTNFNTLKVGCDSCGVNFQDERVLNMHKSLIHNLNDGISLNSEKFQCHLCSKDFKMKGSLMVHLRVVHYGIQSNSSLKNVTAADTDCNRQESEPNAELVGNGNMHIPERNDNKQWFCDVCEKSFTTKYFLKKHKRLHTGETPYACIQCNKTFTFQQSYHKHLLYHNDEKPHTCSYCGRSFKELSTLHNHQRIHTGEKPFSCETCGKCFRQRVSYLVHRRIHTGVMPYKCTACDKSFRYKVSQRTHKCPAQPPGTVVRQSGELLEKLKQKTFIGDSAVQYYDNHNLENIFSELSGANAEVIRYGAKLSFEDTEADNFSMILKSPNNFENKHLSNETHTDSVQPISSISNKQNNDKTTNNIHENITDVSDLIADTKNIDKNIPSPSEILKNLCLTNYDDDNCIANNDTQSTALPQDELNLDIIYKDLKDFL